MQRPIRRLTPVQIERHRKTVELLEQRGEISIEELAEVFGISAMTVHRDLDILEKQGLLRKVRGGAVGRPAARGPVFALDSEASWHDRAQVALREKEAIATRAAERLQRGMTVFIDDSTSCLPLVPYLARLSGITVVTNSLSLTRVLVESGLDVVMIGGTYRPAFDANVGLLAHDAIGRMRLDAVLISTPAVSAGVCYHPDQDSVLVKRAALAAGGERILLVDHTKFTRVAPYSFARLADFTLVVTDTATPEEEYRGHLPAENIVIAEPAGDAPAADRELDRLSEG